ncbi:MAG: hypothetical protein JSV85_03055 [Candidatus Bathyarchaeota archaeon]|nr:MAG: hypothetical protein JSV85_03055 [Candidatus Bathyarchaeota archaeon]
MSSSTDLKNGNANEPAARTQHLVGNDEAPKGVIQERVTSRTILKKAPKHLKT